MRLIFTLMSTLCLFFLFNSQVFAADHSHPLSKSDEVECEIAGELLVHNVSCKGNDNGILIVNMTGGTPPFSYNWSTGVPSDFDILIDLAPGDYAVTVTDADDCTLEFTATVSEPDFLFASASASNETAPGANNGSAFATPFGGTTPYTYQWDDPDNSTIPNISNLPVGDYTVTVTDANECISIQTVTVNAFGCTLNVTSSATQISCFGECDGHTGVIFGGGTAPFVIDWSTGSHASNLSNLCEGVYTVTVTDVNGCTNQNTVVIHEPDVLEVNLQNLLNLGCFGTDDGSISVQPVGGTTPYNYLWSNGQTTGTINSLGIGNYTVTVTDARGCTASLSAEITQAPLLELSVDNSQNVDCSGAATGAASVSAFGGTGNYVYNWSNGMQGSAAQGLVAGTYTVTVTDASNCTAEVNITITEPAPLSVILVSESDVSCFGAADGSAAVAVSGGTLDYNYSWSNGANVGTLQGLGPDTYTLTVSDANQCAETISVEITEPPALSLTLQEIENVSCFGAGDGSINVAVSGGTMPLTTSWSNGEAGTAISNLSPGFYQATLTDGNGCSEILGGAITQPEVLELFVTVTNVSCPSSTQGSIAVSAQGGSPNYSYLWSNGSNVNPIFGLSAGNYMVTVTDQHNCTESAQVIISSLDDEPPVVFASDVNLFLGDDGTVTLPLGQVNNGSFDNCGIASMTLSQSEFDCTNVGMNMVTLTVTDQSGNAAQETVTVLISDLIAPEMTCPPNITVPACEATLDYPMPVVIDNCADVINPVLSAGLPPGATFPTGLTVVSYSFTDGGNNSAICSFEVTVKPALVVDYAETHVSCNGGADGTISITASSGTPDYSYSWEGGFSGADAAGLTAGIYAITVSDSDACEEILSIEILEPNVLGADVDLIVDETAGSANGSIDITPTGGTGPYTYNWSFEGEFFSESGDITGLSAGDYVVEITDANGCIFLSDVITVESLTGTRLIQLDFGFNITPNPSNGLVWMTIEPALTKNAVVSVWDVLGQKVVDGLEVSPGTAQLPLDFSGCSNGTYFIRLDGEAGSFLRKLVVNK